MVYYPNCQSIYGAFSFLGKTNCLTKKITDKNNKTSLAPIEVTSPDLEKQGFFAVVFVNWEYNG
jgi:hypothetical protein